jgi:hypothetical protein
MSIISTLSSALFLPSQTGHGDYRTKADQCLKAIGLLRVIPTTTHEKVNVKFFGYLSIEIRSSDGSVRKHLEFLSTGAFRSIWCAHFFLLDRVNRIRTFHRNQTKRILLSFNSKLMDVWITAAPPPHSSSIILGSPQMNGIAFDFLI